MATLAALGVGFAWGGVTIVRQDRRLLAEPAAIGPMATSNAYLQSAGMGTSEEFLAGIASSRLPNEASVMFVAPVSAVSRQDFWQIYYVASYLLYPRQVWATAWCDPAASAAACTALDAVSELESAMLARGTHYVLLVGTSEVPFYGARIASIQRISSSFRLLGFL